MPENFPLKKLDAIILILALWHQFQIAQHAKLDFFQNQAPSEKISNFLLKMLPCGFRNISDCKNSFEGFIDL